MHNQFWFCFILAINTHKLNNHFVVMYYELIYIWHFTKSKVSEAVQPAGYYLTFITSRAFRIIYFRNLFFRLQCEYKYATRKVIAFSNVEYWQIKIIFISVKTFRIPSVVCLFSFIFLPEKKCPHLYQNIFYWNLPIKQKCRDVFFFHGEILKM